MGTSLRIISYVTRKWFPLQGELASLTKNVVFFYWASEASPTLGCSIEISRDIYLCVCRGPKCARRITWPNTRMLKVSLGRLKPTSDTLIIHFDYTLEQL